MKTLILSIVFIFWCLCTVILACSIIGIIVLLEEDHNCTTFQSEAGDPNWFKIGKIITNELIK